MEFKLYPLLVYNYLNKSFKKKLIDIIGITIKKVIIIEQTLKDEILSYLKIYIFFFF